LRNVLSGASIGRAALEARQKFARSTSMGNPMNIKTLAQFNLYGDPSCSPVKMVDPNTPLPKTPAKGMSYAMVDRIDRASRRRALFIEGTTISATRSVAHESKKPPSKSIQKALASKAKELGVSGGPTKSFVVEGPKKIKGMPRLMAGDELIPSGYHVLLGRERINGKMSKSRRKKVSPPSPIMQIVALVAKEVDGKVVSVTKLYSRTRNNFL
jgi:hypothetical protein